LRARARASHRSRPTCARRHGPRPLLLPRLQANVATGKTDEEAEQLRAEFGFNELEEKKVRAHARARRSAHRPPCGCSCAPHTRATHHARPPPPPPRALS